MKKILFLVSMLWSAIAYAQFVPGQILTAAELNSQFALYAKLTGASFSGGLSATGITATPISGSSGSFTTLGATTANFTTQGYLDNSTLAATDAFVKQTVLAATAEIPASNFTGGTYNFATAGTGAQIVVLVSGGAIQSVLTVAVPGSGYQVGDCLVMVGGNGDAILRVTSLSGSGVTGASVVYGGTGYTTGAQLAAMGLPPGSRTLNMTGTLTSNALIIIPSGTYLQGARRIGFNNNTVSGGFTITVKLSNGLGGSTGIGVVLPTPQNGTNSASTLLYTDGVNDVWPETGSLPSGNLPLSSLAAQSANTVVANATGSSASPTAITVPSCSTTSSALQWTSGSGFGCNTSINASTLGGVASASYALLASPTFTGTPLAPTPTPGTDNTQIATTAFVANTFAPLANPIFTGTVSAVNLTTSGTFTPSQTAGIIGTTTNNNANAGSVGEFISSSTSSTALSTGVVVNAASISLTAGDWDVTGVARFNGTTLISTGVLGGINATSATLGGLGTYSQQGSFGGSASTTGNWVVTLPTVRFTLTSTTTIYAIAEAFFTSGSATVDGFIRARRVR